MIPVTIILGRYSMLRDIRFQQPVRILLASYTSIMGCVFEEEAHIDADEQQPEDIRLEFNRFEKGVTGNVIDTMLSASCYIMDTDEAGGTIPLPTGDSITDDTLAVQTHGIPRSRGATLKPGPAPTAGGNTSDGR